jgi:nucleotide-binding universal stress UspA family protein
MKICLVIETSIGNYCPAWLFHKLGGKMFTRILVPLDGSANAEKALPHARALARTLRIPITLLAVIETVAGFSTEKKHYFDTLIEDSMRNSEEYLEKISKTFPGASIQYRVEKGRAEDAIITNAAADTGTLVTMATHGRSGLNLWLLGSVAEKVVRQANNPVLVVRANEQASSQGEAALDSILVPLDGSALAESVLPYVVELAKDFHAKVTLLRSYSLKQVMFSFEQYTPDLDELKGELKWEAMSYLDQKVAELKSRGIVDVFCSVTEGDAAETIIEMSQRAPNTLIAMSSHSGSTIKHWVLGNVTEKVLRHANKPILTIRT